MKPVQLIAGVDEAGRGPLAGPVVVAAVVLDPDRPIAGLRDSKKLNAATREQLAVEIRAKAADHCVSVIEVSVIDRINILQATLLGMRQALEGLGQVPQLALIDGNRVPDDLPCPGQALIGGDDLEPSISAASILAKVLRDHMMEEMDELYPGYGFARHRGYATAAHRDALTRLGPCPQHRRSFAPVAKLLATDLFAHLSEASGR